MAFTDYDKCSFLLPMDGSNGGTTFADWSPNPKTVTANGNAQTSTAQFKYYDSSGYFDGAGDYLSTVNISGYQLEVIYPWTISFWLRPGLLASRQGLLSTRPPSVSAGFVVRQETDNTLSFGSVGLASIKTTDTVSANTWVHLGIIRESLDTIKLYFNGTLSGSTTSYSNGTEENTEPLKIGMEYSNLYHLNGYLQDILILNDVALWTENFTPPSRLVGEISGVVKDKDDNVAERIITAIPRSNPSRIFQTLSNSGDGTYSLRVPSHEISRIALAEEKTSGTATSGTTSTLVDTSQSWTTNSKAGFEVFCKGEYRVVASNTSDTLTVSSVFSIAPASGDAYTLEEVYNDIVDRIVPE